MRLARLIAFLVFVAVVGLAALLIYRPGTILSASDEALAHSLREEIGVGEVPSSCRESAGGRECVVGSTGRRGAGRAIYSVRTEDWGCWEAERRDGARSGAPAEASGCLTILDFVRVL